MSLGIAAWKIDEGCWPLNDELDTISSPRGVEDLVIKFDLEAAFDRVDPSLNRRTIVHFSEPVVTELWEIARIEPGLRRDLFYSGFEIAAFRKQHRTRYGDEKQYDRVYCEELIEQLDAVGSESFAEGDFQKALQAFQHSLRVKTETLVDFNSFSTSNTIHCIADIYSKQRKWPHALDAYESALHALASDRDQVSAQGAASAVASLERKIVIIRQHIQFADISFASTVSL